MIKANSITDWELFRNRGSIYTYLNSVSYLFALKNETLFTRFDGVMADGFSIYGAIRLFYGVKIRSRSFDITIADSLFRYAQSNEKTVFLIGATQGEAERAVRILEGQYTGLEIAGYRNGYFASEEEMQEACKVVIRQNPDYVIAGMGTPLQERFLLRLKDCGYKGIGFACGGFITHLSMKGIAYYPGWIEKYNIRFLYRFYKEKHTRKRYLKAAFLFPLYFIWNKLK